ncbi:MAG: endonuclease/exonuclease/phosphatase family protein [Sedimentisphaerales bacterium]|nr:endonuclease/exonuclease/phosphatase family protein [Sedimentisphaerales bacterium]
MPVLNAGFESGATASVADHWVERPGEATNSVYFMPAEGPYDEPGFITGRAASIKSTSSAYIEQVLLGITAGDYDYYILNFSIGYRNDVQNEGDIYPVRISIWDINHDMEIVGENIRIIAPGVDNSQSPNIGSIVNRTAILNIDISKHSNENVSLRFSNQYDSGGLGAGATMVIDNVFLEGFRRTAHWRFENNYDDALGEHHGLPYNQPNFIDGISGPAGSKAIECDSDQQQAIKVPYVQKALSPESFTLTAWIKPYVGSSGAYRAVISNRDTDPRSGYVLYATNTNAWSLWTGASGGWYKLNGPPAEENEIVFLAASFEATGSSGDDLIGNTKLFVNGRLAVEDTGVYYKPVVSGYDLLIGAGANEQVSFDYYFDGVIDDVCIYDDVLNKNQVAAMYAEAFGFIQGDLNGDRIVNLPDIAVLCTDWLATYSIHDFEDVVNNWLFHAEPSNLSFMSYNIHHGVGFDGVLDLERIAQVIEQTGADVIGLNEVDNGYWQDVHQAEWLAARLEMDFYFGPTIDDAFGNAILSKYPIICSTNNLLPTDGGQEARACIASVVEIHNRPVTFLVTHFSFNDQQTQIQQADTSLDISNYARGDMILLGDMNSEIDSEPIGHIKQTFRDSFEAAQIVGYNPGGRIDYVFIPWKFNGLVNFTEVVHTNLANIASDHKPVICHVTVCP